jgi:hypothetical protein
MATYPSLAWENEEAFEPEDYESDTEDLELSDEASRRSRRMRAPIRTPQRGGNVPPRPASGFATRAELTATASRLDSKIGQVSSGIKALDGRVRSLDSEQGKLRSALSAESKKREALISQVNNLQQMSMILPLLSTQKTRAVTKAVEGTEIAATDHVVVDNGDQLSRILPMLLFSSAGSASATGQPGSGGGMFGGDNNSMMMLAMAMAFAGGK